MSGIQQMFLGGAGFDTSSWIGLFGLNSANDRGWSCAVDNTGNMYVGGWSAGSYWQIAKYSAAGALQWQKTTTTTPMTAYSMQTDSSGNLYICGGKTSGPYELSLIKYNSSGSLQWQKRASDSVINILGYAVAVDSSGNITTSGYWNSLPIVLKWDSSGSNIWQSYGYVAAYLQSIAFDTSNNSYSFGYVNNGSFYDSYLLKCDSSGSFVTAITYNTGSQVVGTGVAVGASGNISVCGYNSTTGYGFVIKVNSSGTIQWQRILTGISTQWNSIAVDTSDNVYLCGQDGSAGLNHIQLAKYDSSGTIQWQRKISDSSAYASYSYGQSIQVSNGFMYVCGYSTQATTADFFVAKLPTDGSKTGTYSIGGYSMTYAASSVTDSAGALSATSSSPTALNPGLTIYTGTDTFSDSTLTTSVTTL